MATRPAPAPGPAIGLDAIGVYPCTLSLDIGDLCAARGLDAANVRDRLFCEERSVMGPYESVVTLAVNAPKPMLTPDELDRIRPPTGAPQPAPEHENPVRPVSYIQLTLPNNELE